MLAEYLATEQARDRLKTADVLTMPSASEWHGHGQKVVIEQCEAWWRVSVTVADETTAAYYRFDGARYIVTDLGEGVRGLRLRTGWIHGRANGHAMQERETLASGGVGWVAGMSGDIELDGVKPEQLPDAMCRVLLASLRVAGVQL